MSVTLDTSHFERSPVNLPAAGTKSVWNNRLISVKADTSQDPIGPCGPLEPVADSVRHSTIAAWSSALDLGAHSVVGNYNRGYTVGVSVRVLIIIRVSVRVRVNVMLRVRATCGGSNCRGGVHCAHDYSTAIL